MWHDNIQSLYLSVDQISYPNDLRFKRSIKKCTLTRMPILITTSKLFDTDRIVWNKNNQKYEKRNMIFLWNKKILNVRFQDYFFRSDHFLTAVILLYSINILESVVLLISTLRFGQGNLKMSRGVSSLPDISVGLIFKFLKD